MGTDTVGEKRVIGRGQVVMADEETVMGGEGWIRTWPKILRYLDFKHQKSVLNLRDKYSFPLRRLPSGEMVISKGEVGEWLREFSEVSSPFRMQRLTGAALASFNGMVTGMRRRVLPPDPPAPVEFPKRYTVVDWNPSVVSALKIGKKADNK